MFDIGVRHFILRTEKHNPEGNGKVCFLNRQRWRGATPHHTEVLRWWACAHTFYTPHLSGELHKRDARLKNLQASTLKPHTERPTSTGNDPQHHLSSREMQITTTEHHHYTPTRKPKMKKRTQRRWGYEATWTLPSTTSTGCHRTKHFPKWLHLGKLNVCTSCEPVQPWSTEAHLTEMCVLIKTQLRESQIVNYKKCPNLKKYLENTHRSTVRYNRPK